jgi:radical SAM protein with 4Fe4S-binding SPASM domain
MNKAEANPNFHVISGKDILNKKDKEFQEYRKNWVEWPGNYIVKGFPLHLDIEASCLCNLRCPFCATNYEPIGGKGVMSFETFRKIIDEGAANGLCAIKLNSGGRGEPLLNKAVPEMVAYAKKKGIMDVYFNTNATLLTKEVSRRIIDAGLDRISISFEGYTPETYEKYRIGSSFKKVVDNIKGLVNMRNEMEVKNPLVRIQTVALPELAPHFKEYASFWEGIADEVAFIDFKDYGKLEHDLVYDWACPYLWQRIMVRWDGTIAVCQFDYTDTGGLGNVNKGDSIRSAWTGEKMRNIRELNMRGRAHMIPVCNGCSFRTTEIMKQMEKERIKK